jgi:hypothetical protein
MHPVQYQAPACADRNDLSRIARVLVLEFEATIRSARQRAQVSSWLVLLRAVRRRTINWRRFRLRGTISLAA